MPHPQHRSRFPFLCALGIFVLSGCAGRPVAAPRPLPVSAAPVSSEQKVIAVLKVGVGPRSLALDPGAHRACVVCNFAVRGAVSLVNTATNALIKTVSVGLSPTAVAVDPAIHRAFVVNGWTIDRAANSRNRNSVSVVDTSSGTVVATLRVGDRPYGIVLDAPTHRAYVMAGFENAATSSDGTIRRPTPWPAHRSPSEAAKVASPLTRSPTAPLSQTISATPSPTRLSARSLSVSPL